MLAILGALGGTGSLLSGIVAMVSVYNRAASAETHTRVGYEILAPAVKELQDDYEHLIEMFDQVRGEHADCIAAAEPAVSDIVVEEDPFEEFWGGSAGGGAAVGHDTPQEASSRPRRADIPDSLDDVVRERKGSK